MKRTAIGATLAACMCAAPLARAADQFFEHSYAVVIGIDNYPSPMWPKLKYGVKDAQAIAAYLRTQDYDDIIALYDRQATKQAILEAMQNRLAPKLKSKDRVLVFFAGHGYTETLGGKDRGYIVPYDGDTRSAGYISTDELETQSSYMGNARHQLFVMDSCYGGLLAVTRASLVNPNIPDYLNEISGRVARLVITAGGKDQQVLDGGPKGHSYFVDYFLEALAEGKADTNGDGYITFSELSSYLTPRASNRQQTPSFGPLAGHQAGEYLFRSPRGVLTSVSRVEPSSGAVRGAVEPPVRAALTQATPDLPRGIELARAGKCAEALPYLKRGIDVEPENAPAQFYLGHCQYSTGEYQAAYAALTEAIRLDQSRQEYFVDRARAAFELGQYRVASRDVDQALKLNNREPAVYDVRGDIFMKSGEYGEAANAYKYAFDLARDSKMCNKYADAIARNGNRELADDVRRNCGR